MKEVKGKTKKQHEGAQEEIGGSQSKGGSRRMMEETKEGETIRELMKLDLKKKLNERGRKKVTEIKGLKLNKEGMR